MTTSTELLTSFNDLIFAFNPEINIFWDSICSSCDFMKVLISVV